MFAARLASVALIAFAAGPAVGRPDPAEQDLKRLNARVTRNDTRPDKPVVGVRLFSPDVSDDDFRELTRFDRLRSPTADGRKFTGVGLRHLAKLPLEELHLSFTAVTDDGLKEAAKIKTLKVLDLTNCGGVTDDGLPALAALENLADLRVGQNFKVKDVGVIRAVAGMKKLRSLDVANSAVGDGAMKALPKSTPDLRKLVCHGSGVTDAGMRHVGQLKHLAELKASYNLTDQGLADLAGLTELKSLGVWNSSVTAAGLRASPLLPRLKELSVGGAVSGITPEQVDQLRDAAPNCNISTK